jgi:hypothetical protein
MREDLISLVSILPLDATLEMLSISIDSYKKEKNERNLERLRKGLTTVIMKIMVTEQGKDKVTSEVEQISRIRRMFKDMN